MFDDVLGFLYNHDTSDYPEEGDGTTDAVLNMLYAALEDTEDAYIHDAYYDMIVAIEDGYISWLDIMGRMEEYN